MINQFKLDFTSESNEDLVRTIEGVLIDCDKEIPRERAEYKSYLVDLKESLIKTRELLGKSDRIAALSEMVRFDSNHTLFRNPHSSSIFYTDPRKMSYPYKLLG